MVRLAATWIIIDYNESIADRGTQGGPLRCLRGHHLRLPTLSRHHLIKNVPSQPCRYKVPYPSNTSSGGADIFNDNITPFSLTSFIGCLLGYLLVKDEDLVFNIPVTKLLKISVCDILIQIALVAALLRTDYTTMIVVNSTSLLSVVLVGAFCSGVKDSLPNSEREFVALNGTITAPQTRSDRIGK